MNRTAISPPGHPPSVWAPTLAAARRVRAAELMTAYAGAHLVLLSAHPDDETIGFGRLAAAWSAAGPVTGLVATAGEACFDQVLPRPPGLAEVRTAEWRQSLSRLGVRAGQAYGLPDGRLADHEDALAAGLLAAVEQIDGPVLLAATWRDDPHPDHRAAGRAAARVAATRGCPLLEYPVWMTYYADPATAFDPGSELVIVEHEPDAEEARSAALAAYISQLQPWDASVSAVVPPEMVEQQQHQLLIMDRGTV